MKKMFVGRKLILFLALAGGVLAASGVTTAAQVVRVNDARKRVSPRSKTTYADLVKTVFPDAKVYQTTVIEQGKPNRKAVRVEASRSVPLGNLFDRFEKTPFAGLMSIENIEAVRLQTREGERLLLLLTILPIREIEPSRVPEDGDAPTAIPSPETDESKSKKTGDGKIREAAYLNVLALFQLAPQPALLDAADVNKDENYSTVYFSEAYSHLKIRARQDGFFIVNKIPWTEQPITNYFYTLLTATGDRLKALTNEAIQVDESNECVSANNSSISFRVAGSAARRNSGYRPLKAKEVRFYTNRTSDCKTVVARFKTTTVFDLIWNKAKSKYEILNADTKDFNDAP